MARQAPPHPAPHTSPPEPRGALPALQRAAGPRHTPRHTAIASAVCISAVKKNKKKKVLCPNTTGQGLNTWTNRVLPTRPPSSAHLPRGETPTILKLKPRRVAPLL